MAETLRHDEENLNPVQEIKPTTRVERIIGFDEETLKQIKGVEDACFPEDMAETEEELKEVLENPNGIHLRLINGEDMVGYITSLKPEHEVELLKDCDPNFTPEDGTIYLHSIGIKPANRGLRNFNALLKAFAEEAAHDGYKKVSTYARISNGFSKLLQKKFGAKYFRTIENWRDTGEAMDYLEIDSSRQPE